MSKKNIVVLIGGISKNSLNKKLFRAFQARQPEDIQTEEFDISKLPFFSQDIESDPPQVVKDLKNKIKDCDAVFIVTPEYNHSFPGVLKNALDWASRPPKESVWEHKTVALAGVSAGNQGTSASQLHLRQVLTTLNTRAMQKPEFYLKATGEIEESTTPYIDKFWKSFAAFIEDGKK